MNRQYIYGALAIVSIAASADMHADDEHSGVYLGAGTGEVTNKVDDFEADGVAVKFLGGYAFNRYFAAESVYIDAGTLKDTVEGVDLSVEGDGFQSTLRQRCVPLLSQGRTLLRHSGHSDRKRAVRT